jgi:hypothetical protein
MSRLRLLLLALALASPALAQTAPSDGPSVAAGARDAAAQLVFYLQKAARAGNQPDFSKAPAADAFGRVFDFNALAALPAPGPGDLPWLIDWVSAASQASKAILFHRITPPVDPIADRTWIERNMTEMEDQLMLADAFIVRILAREAQSVFLFMDQPEQRTPIREQGFMKARVAVAGTIYTVLCKLTAGLKPANARLAGAAIGDTAEIWARYILPKDRPLIMQQAAKAEIAVGDGEAKKSLAAFSAALAAAE